MSQTRQPRLPLWTPMDVTLCWNFHVTNRSFQSVSFPILRPACLTAVLGSRFFLHSSPVWHCTRQRSLHLVGTSCTSGVPFAALGYLLLNGYTAGQHLRSGHLTTLYPTITCVTCFCSIFLSVLVLSLMLTMLLEAQINSVHSIVPHWRCSTAAVYIQGVHSGVIVSYGPANFEHISWSMQRCHKI